MGQGRIPYKTLTDWFLGYVEERSDAQGYFDWDGVIHAAAAEVPRSLAPDPEALQLTWALKEFSRILRAAGKRRVDSAFIAMASGDAVGEIPAVRPVFGIQLMMLDRRTFQLVQADRYSRLQLDVEAIERDNRRYLATHPEVVCTPELFLEEIIALTELDLLVPRQRQVAIERSV